MQQISSMNVCKILKNISPQYWISAHWLLKYLLCLVEPDFNDIILNCFRASVRSYPWPGDCWPSVPHRGASTTTAAATTTTTLTGECAGGN